MALACAAAAVLAGGLTFTAACGGGYYGADALEGNTEVTVVSNGGFAVEKGEYVYFVNGVETNDASNSYGDVVKGALMRISKDALTKGNYSSGAETVVPLVVYSGDYTGGIYIFGDYVYYSTPSTERNSDGELLNDRLEFKRTKLDGTETMRGYYFQSEEADIEYRFTEVDGTVYLMYVASETLYGEDSDCTNIHSVNTQTGVDTLLAYNVASYVFDSKDITSSYIYYTMGVDYLLGTSNETTLEYNQIYRVSADATADADKYDFSYLGEDYDPEKDPLYVNNGEFVFDGRGSLSPVTQFNYGYNAETGTAGGTPSTISGYEYSLISYEDGLLYYTRSYYSADTSADTTPILFYLTDEEVSGEGWNPVDDNPQRTENSYDGKALVLSAGSVDDYTFITDENNVPTGVVYSEGIDSGYALMSAQFDKDTSSITYGTVINAFPMTTTSGEITFLTFSKETVGVDNGAQKDYTFLYFSVSGEGNANSVHRIALGGNKEDYVEYPAYEQTEAMSNYSDVRILDLDASGGWYMPEVLAGHFFFASQTSDMMDYSYIMAFDLRDDGVTDAVNDTMSNDDIEAINDLYDSVMGDENSVVADTDDEDFENLPNALRYAFYTRDTECVDDFIAEWVAAGEDEEYLFSEESADMYRAFIAAEAPYERFNAYSRNINGEQVFATSRDYYYCVVGQMTTEDSEAYIEALKDDYIPEYPVTEKTWFESRTTGEKVGFIIGVCLGGIIVIGAAVLIPVLVIRKKRRALPVYEKARIKVDTTDDKNIDVYGDDEENK